MDKIKINFMRQDSCLYEYQLRIPEDLNWFIITRYNNQKGNHETEHLIYNGEQVILCGYFFNNEKKIRKHYTESQSDETQKHIICDLLNSIGVNWFSLKILKKLNFKTKPLKRKYWEYYYFNGNIKYILKEIKSDDDEKKYDVYGNDNEETKIGEIYLNVDGNTKINIFPNKKIDISKLYESQIFELSQEKLLKLSRK